MLLEKLHESFDANGFKVANNTKGITKESLLLFIASKQSTNRGGLGYTSSGGISKFLKSTFPNKINKSSYITYLLELIEHKLCVKCNIVKPLLLFHNNSTTTTGYSDYCSDCMCSTRKEYYSNNREKELTANSIREYRMHRFQIPKWSETTKIKEFYSNCPKGFHVDHIVPLNGDNVSGLHVLGNLQYLTSRDNLSKGNKWTVT